MRFIFGMQGFKMNKAGGEGGEGGGGSGGGQGGNGGGGQGGGDGGAALKTLQDKLDAQEKELKTLREKNNSGGGAGGAGGGGNNEIDLREKAEKERLAREKNQTDSKAIESAISFNMGMDNFLKDNKEVLPKEVSDIVEVAKKETYDTAVDRANAIKAAVIQSYFSVQGNLDVLTTSQKETVAEFMKLSKIGREAKAASLYDSVFEPALETNKRVGKAQELLRAKNGYAGSGSSAMDTYKQRLLEAAKRGIINRKKGA